MYVDVRRLNEPLVEPFAPMIASISGLASVRGGLADPQKTRG
jgi:hypothetical protein